jgi:hypothetical protein
VAVMDLLEVEFLLAYKHIIDPIGIKSMDMGEVLFLKERLQKQMKDEEV